MKVITLLGRILFAFIFIASVPGLFGSAAIADADAHGVPLARIAVPLAGIISLIGGLSIALGYRTREGAWLLVLFLVPVTLMMHPFWRASGAGAMVQQIMFLKNVSMLGAALLIANFGGGGLSIDSRRANQDRS